MKRCISLLLLLVILFTLAGCSQVPKTTPAAKEERYLRILCCPENKELEPILNDFAREHNARFDFSYAGALDIIQTLNSGEASNYDAVWLSNSIWTSRLNNSSILKNGKSIFISPVVFAIDRAEGEKLNLIGRDVTLKEIMQAINSSGISFVIPNITRTNSGASIYLSILSTLVGNPEVMTIAQISQDSVTEELKDFFSHVGRTSGSEDYLLELVENGEYNCMVNTESQALALNRRLEAAGKAPMYILYPTDGVSIGDAPLYFVNNNSSREGVFLELQRYLLSSTVQEQLLNRGFRANYGGTIDPKYADVFKASYGIQIDRCLSPVKYPSMPVITEALNRYQLLFRKPTAIVFCLDYSGSMSGDGIRQLSSAMDYILDNEKTSVDFLQFSGADSVTVLGFSDEITGWKTGTGDELYALRSFVRNTSPSGSTNIYLAALKAFEILEQYPDDYIKSVVLMTDGRSNCMTFEDFARRSMDRKIYPVYSITFGSADTKQLNQLAKKTGGKVFDGVNDLTNAFREVRGYN